MSLTLFPDLIFRPPLFGDFFLCAPFLGDHYATASDPLDVPDGHRGGSKLEGGIPHSLQTLPLLLFLTRRTWRALRHDRDPISSHAYFFRPSRGGKDKRDQNYS